MAIIKEYHEFLASRAVGKWHETYRFKNKDTDEYLHSIQRGMLLLRVETDTKRAFYWLYRVDDAIRFNEYVGLKLHWECHEIILSTRCRLFYDIDLALNSVQKEEFADHFGFELMETNEISVMNEVGKALANVFMKATLTSLEYNDVEKQDLNGVDWMFTSRNRVIDNGGFKISIHLLTNIMIPLSACAAVAEDVKQTILPMCTDELGITDDMMPALCESIDETQYRRHGSLSLPYGTKKTPSGVCTNWIMRNYSTPSQLHFITIDDRFTVHDLDLAGYNIVSKSDYVGKEACPEFVKEALEHAHNIKDYNTRVWDLNTSILKRSTMYVKRYAPSMCSACKRIHDNDNTLFLIFNSEQGIASWKCARNPSMKSQIFYRKEDIDVDAFANKFSSKNKREEVVVKVGTSDIEDDEIAVFAKKYEGKKCTTFQDIDDPFDRVVKTKKVFMRIGNAPNKKEDTSLPSRTGKFGYHEDRPKAIPKRSLVKRVRANTTKTPIKPLEEY